MKKYKNIILTSILIGFIFNIDLVLNATKDSCIIFFNNIFISIFPFIILSDILIYYDYHIFLKNIFGNIISKLFNIDSNTCIIIILSVLTSSPTNAIYIKDMLDNNLIDINTSNKLLTFTYNPSISFVLSTGYILGNYKIGLLIWILIILNNTLIGLYLRKDKSISTKEIIIKKEKSIFDTIKKSILKSINTSFIILGTLIIFKIIITLINNNLNINPILLSIINSLLEMTSGITYISTIKYPLIIKIPLIIFTLSFSGLSIIFQSISILSNYSINIKKILTIKLISSSLLSIVIYMILNLIQ